jgi:hypothetical protein
MVGGDAGNWVHATILVSVRYIVFIGIYILQEGGRGAFEDGHRKECLKRMCDQ